MNPDLMVWEDRYEVGVPSIDEAHQEFFRITRRLILLGEEPAKHKWVAKEGLKFLKVYVMNHFADEEAYMASISYGALDQHRQQHDIFRNRVLPNMESNLAHKRYAGEAIEKFLQILQLWLSRHIMVHDKAITRNTNYFA